MTGRTTNATLRNVSFPAGYKGEAEVSRGLAILATYEPAPKYEDAEGRKEGGYGAGVDMGRVWFLRMQSLCGA